MEWIQLITRLAIVVAIALLGWALDRYHFFVLHRVAWSPALDAFLRTARRCGKPVMFDAIEFDPIIATTDILYDLAFPLMDLIHFDQRAAANALFNTYLDAAGEAARNALVLFPLFTVPIYIYYDKTRVNTVHANYREGFVDLASWGLHASETGAPAKGGCGGQPE